MDSKIVREKAVLYRTLAKTVIMEVSSTDSSPEAGYVAGLLVEALEKAIPVDGGGEEEKRP